MQLALHDLKCCLSWLQRAGLAPTGILTHSAKTLGYTSVANLLAINPDAVHHAQKERDDAQADGTAAPAKKKRKPKAKKGEMGDGAASRAEAGAVAQAIPAGQLARDGTRLGGYSWASQVCAGGATLGGIDGWATASLQMLS